MIQSHPFHIVGAASHPIVTMSEPPYLMHSTVDDPFVTVMAPFHTGQKVSRGHISHVESVTSVVCITRPINQVFLKVEPTIQKLYSTSVCAGNRSTAVSKYLSTGTTVC